MNMGLKSNAYVENYAKMHAAKVSGNTSLYEHLKEWCDVFETMAKHDRSIDISYLRQKASEFYVKEFGISLEEADELDNEDVFVMPDPVMEEHSDSELHSDFESEDEYEYVDYNRALDDFDYFCTLIEILWRPGMGDYCENGGMGPLFLTVPQKKMAGLMLYFLFTKKVPVRIMLLKARQMGFTTVLLAFWVWLLIQIKGFKIMFIIDKDEHMYGKRDEVVSWFVHLNKLDSRFPKIVKKEGKSVLLSNKAKMFFESAQAPNPGTSEMLHALHLSERPKWGEKKEAKIMASIMGSISSKPGTLIIDESTAEGMGRFKEDWDRLKDKSVSDFVPVFIPWFLSDEYRKIPPSKCYRPDGSFIYLNEDKEVCELNPNGTIANTEEEFANEHGLSVEQMYWRRTKIKVDFHGDQTLFNQEYPTTPDHAWSSLGVTYFSGPLLKAIESGLEDPVFVGNIKCDVVEQNSIRHLPHYTKFEGISLTKDRDIPLSIWEFPKEGRYYIGADVSQGKQVNTQRGVESDYSCIYVIDSFQRTVARYHGHIKPEELPFYLVCLGLFYNNARINCERNKDGETVWAFFEPVCYPNIFYRDDSKGRVSDYAWSNIGPSQRNPTINLVRATAIEDPTRIRDRGLYKEMCNLLRKQNGTLEPRYGYHDDCILARAHAIRCAVGYTGLGKRYKEEKKTKDVPWNLFEALMEANGIDAF